ncbi:MAG: LacI family DNA-binding transcriptional regulator [Alphaproteobacteria bacterium]
MTIKDVAGELGLSITTISRALNGYSDVGEKTRKRVRDTAERLGYHPNRNAQRLVTQRTRNVAWVQTDNELKYLDPHFAEVMAGVLSSARGSNYDIVLTSHGKDREIPTYERYVHNNSVDGFIVDLPREDDERITYLMKTGLPFVVHGRERRNDLYGWVDMDNYGNFYRLARLLIANGHRRIALINGDEDFNYALYRHNAIRDAAQDAGLPADTFSLYNSSHPMGDAGFRLTQQALTDKSVTAVIYSSILLLMAGYELLLAAGERKGRPLAVATMDDQLRHLDPTRLAPRISFVRSSLHDAGFALIEELSRQCDDHLAPTGTLVPSSFHIVPDLDGSSVEQPLPPHRRNLVG